MHESAKDEWTPGYIYRGIIPKALVEFETSTLLFDYTFSSKWSRCSLANDTGRLLQHFNVFWNTWNASFSTLSAHHRILEPDHCHVAICNEDPQMAILSNLNTVILPWYVMYLPTKKVTFYRTKHHPVSAPPHTLRPEQSRKIQKQFEMSKYR